MSNIVTFNNTILQSSVYGNYSHYVQEILQAKKWISFYIDGKKYFLFYCRGKIFYVSEFILGLILCSVFFFRTLAIRKLIKRFKIKKKNY